MGWRGGRIPAEGTEPRSRGGRPQGDQHRLGSSVEGGEVDHRPTSSGIRDVTVHGLYPSPQLKVKGRADNW